MENYRIGEHKALDLAAKYGTPLYVYDLAKIRAKFKILRDAFSEINPRIHYACKANEAPEILYLMKDLGAGLDTVSPNEIMRALKIGFSPEDIIFTPSCPDITELEFALEAGIRIHFGDAEYLEMLGEKLRKVKIGLRLNPDVSIGGNQKIATAHANSKFGIPVTQLEAIKNQENKFGFKVVTLHVHTGSDVKSWQDLARSFDSLLKHVKLFDHLECLDIGSGLKVKYNAGDHEIDLQSYAAYITGKIKAEKSNLKIILEPGKFLVAEAGTMLAKVNVVKQGYNKQFVGINSGSNHLIRPMYYNAYHHIINISNINGQERLYDIVGILCEEDTFASDRTVAEVKTGDILAIENTGAYGYSMASFYNLRDKPGQVILDGSEKRLISEEKVSI